MIGKIFNVMATFLKEKRLKSVGFFFQMTIAFFCKCAIFMKLIENGITESETVEHEASPRGFVYFQAASCSLIWRVICHDAKGETFEKGVLKIN